MHARTYAAAFLVTVIMTAAPTFLVADHVTPARQWGHPDPADRGPRKIVKVFTIRTQPDVEFGFGRVLTEYQFAGDTEGHGVPRSGLAH